MFSHSKAGFGNWFVFHNHFRMIIRINSCRFGVRTGLSFTKTALMLLREKKGIDFPS